MSSRSGSRSNRIAIEPTHHIGCAFSISIDCGVYPVPVVISATRNDVQHIVLFKSFEDAL